MSSPKNGPSHPTPRAAQAEGSPVGRPPPKRIREGTPTADPNAPQYGKPTHPGVRTTRPTITPSPTGVLGTRDRPPKGGGLSSSCSCYRAASTCVLQASTLRTYFRPRRGRVRPGGVVRASFSRSNARCCRDVAGDTEFGAVDLIRSVNGAAIRAKLGTNRRKTLHILTKLHICVRIVGKCASRSARLCASITPSRPGLILCPRNSTVLRKHRHLGRRSVTVAPRSRRRTR